VTLLFATELVAAELGSKGGPEPANMGVIADHLRADPCDLELLICFGTAKAGSACRRALGIRVTGVPAATLDCGRLGFSGHPADAPGGIL
jgi:hypothetical protein